ncbi:MAG TPA: DsrE family protein [Methanomassiliicoccales archaeon]|nr:DsrE family protein [Methanomassiliicoccales archaeon]
MKLGMILYSNDPETVYQAFRLGIFSLGQGDQVNMFLLAKGVECEDLDNEQFNITKEIRAFLDAGGRTYSCTSCMKLRAKGETSACPLSKMADLYRIIAESDRVITL